MALQNTTGEHLKQINNGVRYGLDSEVVFF